MPAPDNSKQESTDAPVNRRKSLKLILLALAIGLVPLGRHGDLGALLDVSVVEHAPR